MNRLKLTVFIVITAVLYGCMSKNGMKNSGIFLDVATPHRGDVQVVQHGGAPLREYISVEDGMRGGLELISIENASKNIDAEISGVTTLLSIDEAGVEMAFCEKSSKATIFYLYVIKKQKNSELYIITLGAWGTINRPVFYLVEQNSPFEEKICNITDRIIQNSSCEQERYNAKELMKVVKDRRYECKWRKFLMVKDGEVIPLGEPPRQPVP